MKDDQFTRKVIKTDKWHHVGVLRLIEFSEPVNLEKECRKREWQSVKVEQGFLQILVGSFTYNIYSPWSVEIACKKKKRKKMQKQDAKS